MKRHLKRKLLSLAISGCIAATSMTGNTIPNTLKVKFADGSDATFTLSDELAMDFRDGSMTITGSENRYDINDVTSFSYECLSAIPGTAPDVTEHVTLHGDRLTISGTAENAVCAITDLSGITVLTSRLTHHGVIDLSALGSGVYIATLPSGKTIKILRK